MIRINALSHRQQKFLFIFGITVIYLALLVWFYFLNGPLWIDEKSFWPSSRTFSDDLWPTVEELTTYGSLNTPLPFIIFGGLDYLFGGEAVPGRVLNFILSLVIIGIIGWPSQAKGGRALLSLIGLFLCPYFLGLSGRLYTEMLASIWVLIGFMAYFRNRHILSTVAFILGIASRQYMIAFPLAVASYEMFSLIQDYRLDQRLNWGKYAHSLAPVAAIFSLGFWILIFGGLAPQAAIEIKAPEVQRSLFALVPGGIVNFLAFVGLYLVIPEFILFRPAHPLRILKANWPKYIAIAVGLLIFCLLFPPLDYGNGNLMKVGKLIPIPWLHGLMFYSLALLACLRFSKPDLFFWLVLFNALIMIKAWPWDRYVLPLAIVFWYMKSINYPHLVASYPVSRSQSYLSEQGSKGEGG